MVVRRESGSGLYCPQLMCMYEGKVGIGYPVSVVVAWAVLILKSRATERMMAKNCILASTVEVEWM